MQQPVEVLITARARRTVEGLQAGLADHEVAADVATDPDQARELFLERGGHRVLVLGPDVGQGFAQQVVDQLRGIDPELSIVVFGSDAFRQATPSGFTRIADLHPGSRAGIGAVLKVVRSTSCGT